MKTLINLLDEDARYSGKKVGDDSYEYEGKIGKWRTAKNGDRMFFPDDGSLPLGGSATLKHSKKTPPKEEKHKGDTEKANKRLNFLLNRYEGDPFNLRSASDDVKGNTWDYNKDEREYLSDKLDKEVARIFAAEKIRDRNYYESTESP